MDLVADIGGTNTRLALAENGRPLDESTRSFRNRQFTSFDDPLGAFLSEMGNPMPDAVCVAIAGPVKGSHGKLTNLNWDFETGRIAQVSRAKRAVLINDLAALGHALPHLHPNQTKTLRPVGPGDRRNGQSFVLGLGTGVNIATNMGDGRVLEAEAGHAGLPAQIHGQLADAIGEEAVSRFPSLEELFAGRGLAALHGCMSGVSVPAHEVIARPDATAQKCVTLYARLLGLALRELILYYLPLEGVYFAGSVARGVLGVAQEPFLGALGQPHLMQDIIAAPSVSLILDDAAALHGCAARIQADKAA